MNGQFHISGFGLVVVLLVGIALYVALKAVRSFLKTLPMSKPRRALVNRFRPLVEALTIVLYVVFSVNQILTGEAFYSTIVLGCIILGVIVISWAAIRDLVAGLLLKASEVCMPGDAIEVDGIVGRVKGLGYRVIAVDTLDGGQAFIPYSRVSRSTLVRRPVADGAYRHTFEIKLPKDIESVEGQESIRLHILNSHYASAVREPRIEVNDNGTLSITVFSVAPNQGHRIESSVRKAFESRRPSAIPRSSTTP